MYSGSYKNKVNRIISVIDINPAIARTLYLCISLLLDFIPHIKIWGFEYLWPSENLWVREYVGTSPPTPNDS